MKKLFFVLLVMIGSLNLFAQNDDPLVINYIELQGKATTSFLNYYSKLTDEEKGNLSSILQGVELEMKNGKDITETSNFPTILKLFGFESGSQFFDYCKQSIDLSKAIKEKYLSGQPENNVQNFFSDLIRLNIDKFIPSEYGSKAMDCMSDCRSDLAGCLMSAAGAAGTALTSCTALTFPPAVGVCMGAVMITYGGGLVLCNNGFNRCAKGCKGKSTSN